MGIVLIHFSDAIEESITDYTFCTDEKGMVCANVIKENPLADCQCTIPITLKEDIPVRYKFYVNYI